MRAWLRTLVGRRRRTGPAPTILMYHRVASLACDPWDLAVAPERFEAQMRWIDQNRMPLSLDDFAARLEEGMLPANAIAVTFDDGYVDNLTAAKPALERHGVPATVFLATDWLGGGREFWWDELARLILEDDRPLAVELDLGEAEPYRIDLTSEPRAGGVWRGWEPPRTERERVFAEVWAALRKLPIPARDSAMETLRASTGDLLARPEDLPMTLPQVTDLLSGGMVTVGGHTLTHPVLPWLSREDQLREIQGSRDAIERIAGKAVDAFAYPFGDQDAVAQACAAEAGFRYAVTTREAPVVAKDAENLFTLPRVQALDWDADGLAQALEAA